PVGGGDPAGPALCRCRIRRGVRVGAGVLRDDPRPDPCPDLYGLADRWDGTGAGAGDVPGFRPAGHPEGQARGPGGPVLTMAIPPKTPLAWCNLVHDPRALATSMMGIAFAVLLMLIMTGFRNAMFDSQIELLRLLNTDLIVTAREKE